MNNKRLAIIFPKDSKGFYDPEKRISFGGATVQLDMISHAILGKVSKLDLFLPDYNEIKNSELGERGFHHLFSTSDNFIVKVLKTLNSLLRFRPHYIIQRGLTYESALLAIFCRIIGIRYIFMFAHDIELSGQYQNSRKKSSFYSLLLRASSVLVCQNEQQLANVNKQYLNKSIIFKKGIPIKRISPLKDEKKTYRAMWIGRCVRWKNPELFLDLAKKHPNEKFLFICINGNDLEYYNQVIIQASQFKNITIATYVENHLIYSLISKSELLCITSDMEGDCPMTLLESGVMGVPVLAYCSEFNVNIGEYGGCLFADNNLELFFDNYEKIFRSPKAYTTMTKGIREYVHQYHDIDKNIITLLEELQKV